MAQGGGPEETGMDLDQTEVTGGGKKRQPLPKNTTIKLYDIKESPACFIPNLANSHLDYLVTNIARRSTTPKLYIRNAYKNMYELVAKTIRVESEPYEPALIHIGGTPRIGKTHFLYYLMCRLPFSFPWIRGFLILSTCPGNPPEYWLSEIELGNDGTGKVLSS